MRRVCSIPGCEREISEKSRSTVCSNCRASMYSWAKRTPAEVIRRRINLTTYSNRMDNVLGGVKVVNDTGEVSPSRGIKPVPIARLREAVFEGEPPKVGKRRK
jgi:hypothetical protein